jgi:cytoskeletal protein CcmA (bactofilin family)
MTEVRTSVVDEDQVDTVLGADVEFSGRIRSDKSFMIKGKVRGSFVSDSELYITEGAVVNADLRASQVTIRGSVKGDIVATRRIQALAGSDVEGTLSAPEIAIEPGCRFNGSCVTTVPADDAR